MQSTTSHYNVYDASSSAQTFSPVFNSNHGAANKGYLTKETSPSPSTSSSVSVSSKHASRSSIEHPTRRVSTRARSARLAASPTQRPTQSSPSSKPSSDAPRSTPRTRMTARQRQTLEEHFALNSQPAVSTRKQIAAEIGVTTDKVTNWFRNLRQSLRKQQEGMGRRGQSSSDDEDGEYEVLTPDRSPYAEAYHSFPSPPMKPRSVDPELMEDAILFLHFVKACNLESKPC